MSSSALRFTLTHNFLFSETVQVYLRGACFRVCEVIYKKVWVIQTFRKHPKSSKFVCIKVGRSYLYLCWLCFWFAFFRMKDSTDFWGLFAKVREKSVEGFRSYFHFCKNEVLNVCRYLKRFYTYKKINDIFLKFYYYLLRMQKIVEIGWIFHSEKRESKT